MKVSYHGHSVVKIEHEGTKILIDPFINGNSQCDLDADTVEADVIILTHGHNDHVGDTVDIARRNESLVIAPNELADYLGQKGLNTHNMHIGGSYHFDFGQVKYTQAFHGSSFVEDDGTIVYTGMPAGVLVTINNQTIYHMGDTGLFSDLKLIGDLNDIDLAFVPIGDNFTMGPEDAELAVEWIKAKKVVPIHYNTFPVIEQDPQAFVNRLKPGKGEVLTPGDSITL